MKKTKHKEVHTSPNKIGSGDYYGQAIRQKIGIPREIMMEKKVPRTLKKPPKSLA